MQYSEREQERHSYPAVIALQYPTLPFNGRVASWLMQSEHVNMATNTEEPPFDDTSSSLGDSAYEFIDDSSISIATSDDEDQEHTERSTSSIEEHENEQEHEQEFDNDHDQHQHQHQAGGVKDEDSDLSRESQAAESSHSHTGSQGLSGAGDPMQEHVETTPIEQSREFGHHERLGPSYVMFEEPKALSSYSREQINVSHVVKTFSEQETSDILSHIHNEWRPAQLIATARQSMIQRGLSVDEPYRVLYVGDTSAKAAIVSKIAAALNSNQDHGKAMSQRFNVIPISSFGGGSSPEVELIDSLGPEMIVDECTSAVFGPNSHGRDIIYMVLNKNRRHVSSTWNGSRFVIGPKWKQPDVAIFYLSDNDDIAAKQVRGRARSFMSRHSIPTVVISESPLWGRAAKAITLEHKSLHLCIEGVGSECDGNRVLKRLPIDLATFLEVDVGQLGRNLACLALANGEFSSTTEEVSIEPGEDGNASDDVEKSSLRLFGVSGHFGTIRKYMAPEIRSMLILGSILFLAMVYTTATLSLQKFTQLSTQAEPSHGLAKSSAPAVSTSATTVSFVALSTTTSVRPCPVPSEGAHNSVPKSISVTHTNTDLASFLLDSHALAPNKSDQFKIHVIGDCHIVLRPPHWFTLLRRAPKLFFKVTRKDETVEHQLSTLFDGVYALKLPREHAHGALNVSVWTRSKPRLSESFQVDFGTPWLKVAGWKKAAQMLSEQLRRDWDRAQISLANVINHTSTGLHTFMEDSIRIADGVRREAEKIGKTSLNQTIRTTELIITQTKALPYGISRQYRSQGLAASKRLSAHGGRFSQGFACRVREASRLMSHHARVLSQALTGVDVRGLGHEVSVFRKRHLRESQKSALRLWWRIRGVSPRKPSRVGANSGRHSKHGKYGGGGNR